jgi:thiol-disulfide isomerase/thioredoxin
MTARRTLRAAVAAMALAVSLVLTACSGGSNAVDQAAGAQFRFVQASQKGSVIAATSRKAAGALHGSLLAGGDYELTADKGHVVVLNFFATWCGPCQTETPQLDALYRQRKAAGVKFVGLDVKDGTQSGSRAWLAAKDITYPIVWDQPGKTAIELGNVPIAGLPATVIIDKQGRVAAVYTGIVLPADITPAIDTLSAETA